jgi:hypothetical protein
MGLFASGHDVSTFALSKTSHFLTKLELNGHIKHTFRGLVSRVLRKIQ